jgi:type I restriction enzyme S subunit
MMTSDWKSFKLSEITYKIGSGATPRGGKNSYKASGISLVRSLNVYDFKFKIKDLAYIDEEQAKKLSNVTLEESDILLNITGASVARCTIIPDGILPARVNQHVAIIRIKKNIADPYFVLYAINSNYYKHRLLSLAQGGATREALTKEMIEKFEINLPPLTTQQKIASILSTYDDLIENNHHRISILEEMAQKLYREWFVKFRFPEHEDVKMVDSELGEIPEGWVVSKIADMYKTSSGGTPSRKEPEYYDNGHIPWVKTKELKDCFLIESEEKITDLGLKGSSAKIFPKHSVLLAMYGATIGKLGIISQEASSNQACCALIVKEESFSPWYAYLYLYINRNHIIGQRMGAAQQNISQQIVKDFSILKPTLEIMSSFNEIVEPIFLQIENLQTKNQNLKKQRDLLLPKLISGKIEA